MSQEYINSASIFFAPILGLKRLMASCALFAQIIFEESNSDEIFSKVRKTLSILGIDRLIAFEESVLTSLALEADELSADLNPVFITFSRSKAKPISEPKDDLDSLKYRIN